MLIERIAFIGAGAVGRELAYLGMRAGIGTLLEDVNRETLDFALVHIRTRLNADVSAGELSPDNRDAALARLTTSQSIEDAMRTAKLIVDTTLDELETKLEIFTIFDKFALPDAILASCTTSLSVSDIATITFHADHCLALRFVGDASRLKRVEIVRSAQNVDAVVKACEEMASRMGLEASVMWEPADITREARSQ
jgi:3-hydroxybutyryl-CoA dehydrogenase